MDSNRKGDLEVMKRGRAAAMGGLVVFALGCGGATEPEIELDASLVSATTEIVLRHGEEARVQDGPLRVAFVRVVADSRCPIDAVCVWMGNAEVEIGLAAGTGPTFPVHLNTELEPRGAQWHSVRITLLEVQPAPRAATPTRAEDYSIKLRLEPV